MGSSPLLKVCTQLNVDVTEGHRLSFLIIEADPSDGLSTRKATAGISETCSSRLPTKSCIGLRCSGADPSAWRKTYRDTAKFGVARLRMTRRGGEVNR